MPPIYSSLPDNEDLLSHTVIFIGELKLSGSIVALKFIGQEGDASYTFLYRRQLCVPFRAICAYSLSNGIVWVA